MNTNREASVLNNGQLSTAGDLITWRDWFYPMLEISTVQDGGEPSRFENKVWDLGGILLSSAVAPATHVKRGKLNISRAPMDHWAIGYNRSGTTTIASDKRTLEAPPRSLFLWSFGEKTSSYRSDVDRIQLLIPRDLFRDVAPMLDAQRGSVLNTDLGSLLSDYMLFLESRLESVEAQDLPRLTGAVRAMIAACVAPSRERAEIAAVQIDNSRRDRIRRVIDLNLRSRALNPAMICKTVGVSRSQLYRLFEHWGGVMRYVQRQRLLRAHAILSDSENTKSISSIAEEFSFAEASSFSRAFRDEFGHSPKDVKLSSQAGMPIGVNARHKRSSKTRRFYDLIEKSPIF
jgi:AraC-like DNA-binding protein